MNFKDEISKATAIQVEKLGFDSSKLAVSFSNRPELCDFQTNYALYLEKWCNE